MTSLGYIFHAGEFWFAFLFVVLIIDEFYGAIERLS